MGRLIHVYGGWVLVTLGFGLIYWPGGLAVGGAVLFWLGLTWVKE